MSKNNPEFDFPVPSYEDWLKAARFELNGTDPLEKLSVLQGSIKIKPYYCGNSENSETGFELKPAINPYYGARSWLNMPRIVIEDEKKANQRALHYLNTGAEGILFEPRKKKLNIEWLLSNIKPEFCALSFFIQNNFADSAFDFKVWCEHKGVQNSITGAFFWESFPANRLPELIESHSLKNYATLGHSIPAKTTGEDEIIHALRTSVDLLDMATGMAIDRIVERFAFSVSVGSNFFLEIAKLKALRNLWYQVQGAYGVKEIKPVHIQATSHPWTKAEFQPHGTMIASTLNGLAAIAGGCDSLTVEPEDDVEMARRVARNVSSILREEAYLSKVADPLAGSYYLDALLANLSEKVWQKFQSEKS